MYEYLAARSRRIKAGELDPSIHGLHKGCSSPLLAPSRRKAHRGHINKLMPTGNSGLCTIFQLSRFRHMPPRLCVGKAWRGDKLNAHGISVRSSFTVSTCLFASAAVGVATARYELPNEVALV
jgi:hypothetical protein